MALYLWDGEGGATVGELLEGSHWLGRMPYILPMRGGLHLDHTVVLCVCGMGKAVMQAESPSG